MTPSYFRIAKTLWQATLVLPEMGSGMWGRHCPVGVSVGWEATEGGPKKQGQNHQKPMVFRDFLILWFNPGKSDQHPSFVGKNDTKKMAAFSVRAGIPPYELMSLTSEQHIPQLGRLEGLKWNGGMDPYGCACRTKLNISGFMDFAAQEWSWIVSSSDDHWREVMPLP